MRMQDLQKEYLFTMVQTMYRFEASLVLETKLLTDSEEMDFYLTYMAIPNETWWI